MKVPALHYNKDLLWSLLPFYLLHVYILNKLAELSTQGKTGQKDLILTRDQRVEQIYVYPRVEDLDFIVVKRRFLLPFFSLQHIL